MHATCIEIAKQFLKARRNQLLYGRRTVPTPNMASNVTLSIGATVKLTDEDMKYSISKGTERYSRNRKVGAKEQKYKKQRSGIEICIQGVFGERGVYHMVGITDFSLLDDTTPQGIRSDRGDLVLDDERIDVKTCLGDEHNDLWVRAHSFANPSSVYAMLTFQRGSQALPRRDKRDDTENTFVEHEDLTLIFRGAVSAYDLFHPEWLDHDDKDFDGSEKEESRRDPKYKYPQNKMMNLEDAIARFKMQHAMYNETPELQELKCCVPEEEKEESALPPAKKRRTQ
jgi:hypothetical protein